MNATTLTPSTKPRRRWFQFGLRTLLVTTTLLGVGAAWVGLQVNRALDKRAAVQALRAARASVRFGEPRSWLARSGWLRSLLGDDALSDVVEVAVSGIGTVSGSITVWDTSEFGDDEIVHLHCLTQLERLFLNNTHVTDAGLARWNELTQLKYVGLGGTQVTDVGLSHLRGLTQLRVLRLNNTRVTDEGLVHLRELTQLKWLWLDDAQVTDAGLAHLSGLTQLEWLSLDNTLVTGEGLTHLRGMMQLEVLVLNNTQVTDEGLANLRGLTKLRRLSLDNTQVTDAGVSELEKSLPNTTIQSSRQLPWESSSAKP